MKFYTSSIFILYVYRSITTCNTSTTLKQTDVRNYLGTRTPYRFRCNNDDSSRSFPDCKELKIWMLIRHGTRLPSRSDVIGMNSTLNELRDKILLAHKEKKGNLKNQEALKFAEWSPNIKEENSKFLAKEGQEEMMELAERTMKRFPNAVKDNYSNSSYYFRYTPTQRAQQSAVYFTRGLFALDDFKKVQYAPAKKIDTVLRYYKHCDKWQKRVKKNPDTYAQQNLFAESMEMRDALNSVTKKLGLSETLTLEQASLMYKICGFETAWHKYKDSPWCLGFDQTSAEVLEYFYDLKHFWLDGYGHELTRHQACITMRNMLESLSSYDGPLASFLFTHSGMILKFLTHLRLYETTSPLLGNEVQKDRVWKTSYIDSFGANIAFVMYQCKKEKYILALHQERIIKLPMCSSELCPFRELQQYFSDLHECDEQNLCVIPETTDNNS